jgi:hypothetical protein
MPQSLIDFDWQRLANPQGYQLVTRRLKAPIHYHRPSRRPQPDLFEMRGQWGLAYHPLGVTVLRSQKGKAHRPAYITATSSNFESYRPLEIESLFLEFATLHTTEDVLDFVKKFGALTRVGPQIKQGELVEGVLEHSRAMRELLEMVGRGYIGTLAATQYNPFSELEVSLAQDPTSGLPIQRYVPSSLLDALWLQAVQALQGGTVVRQCHHCGHPFKAGIGTGRRLDAKFCSEEHKITFHSLKRSREK